MAPPGAGRVGLSTQLQLKGLDGGFSYKEVLQRVALSSRGLCSCGGAGFLGFGGNAPPPRVLQSHRCGETGEKEAGKSFPATQSPPWEAPKNQAISRVQDGAAAPPPSSPFVTSPRGDTAAAACIFSVPPGPDLRFR